MPTERQVYLNGDFVPESQAKISIYDSALMFGDMVFEMTRSFQKKHFKLREHLERLYASVKFLRIPLKVQIDHMENLCYEVAARNEREFQADDEHRLMISISRGPLSIYADVFGGKVEPTIVIADFPLRWTVAGMGRLFDAGINAVIPSQRTIPAHLLDPKVKNRSRLHYMLANIEVSNWAGDDNWALLLDPDGFIAEGTGYNFFIVKDNIIQTPEGRNVLRGVSRAYVLRELAPQLEMKAVEINLDLYDVLTAQEAFITATPFNLLPVTRLNGVCIGDGQVGSVTRALLSQWSKNVGVDIVSQIKAWDEGRAGRAAQTVTPYKYKSQT